MFLLKSDMRFIKERHPVDKHCCWKFGHILLGDQFHHILQNLVHSTLRAVPRRQNLTVHSQAIETQKHSYNDVHTQNSRNSCVKCMCQYPSLHRDTSSQHTLPSTQQEMSFKRLDLGFKDFLKLFWVSQQRIKFRRNLFYPKFYWNSITYLKRTTSLETLHLDEFHTSDHSESRSQIRQTRCRHRVHTQKFWGKTRNVSISWWDPISWYNEACSQFRFR